MCNAAVTLLKLHVHVNPLGFRYSAHSGLGGLNGIEILHSKKLPGDVHQPWMQTAQCVLVCRVKKSRLNLGEGERLN